MSDLKASEDSVKRRGNEQNPRKADVQGMAKGSSQRGRRKTRSNGLLSSASSAHFPLLLPRTLLWFGSYGRDTGWFCLTLLTHLPQTPTDSHRLPLVLCTPATQIFLEFLKNFTLPGLRIITSLGCFPSSFPFSIPFAC